MHSIPPTHFIKVASDAKPYSKLQPTTLNGGEGGGVYFINDMYYWRRIFVRMAPFQSECLNNFATSCRTNKSKVFGGYVVMLAKITDIPQS